MEKFFVLSSFTIKVSSFIITNTTNKRNFSHKRKTLQTSNNDEIKDYI